MKLEGKKGSKLAKIGHFCIKKIKIAFSQNFSKVWFDSFVFMVTEAFNRYELNGQWFGDEDSFRTVAKWKVFQSNPNGNVTWVKIVDSLLMEAIPRAKHVFTPSRSETDWQDKQKMDAKIFIDLQIGAGAKYHNRSYNLSFRYNLPWDQLAGTRPWYTASTWCDKSTDMMWQAASLLVIPATNMSSTTAFSKSSCTKPLLLMAGRYSLLVLRARSRSKMVSSLMNPGGYGSPLSTGRPESSAESRCSHIWRQGPTCAWAAWRRGQCQ